MQQNDHIHIHMGLQYKIQTASMEFAIIFSPSLTYLSSAEPVINLQYVIYWTIFVQNHSKAFVLYEYI